MTDQWTQWGPWGKCGTKEKGIHVRQRQCKPNPFMCQGLYKQGVRCDNQLG